MARARSSDVPAYDTYPAPTPSEAQSMPQDWPYEPKSDEYRPGNERLNQTAEQIGTTVGRAVAMARHARDRFGVIRGGQAGPGMTERIQETVDDLTEQTREKMSDLRDAASQQMDELSSRARDAAERARVRVNEATERARLRVNEAREQAQRYARENPLRVIAAAMVAGILLGIGLRIWRASDE